MTKLNDKRVKELHALCSFIKGESSERTMENLLDMRDLCGGHGFSIYSRFPSFIKDTVVQTTWEGSNGVLIQQTAKFLLDQFAKYIQKGEISLKSFEFLREFEDDEKTLQIGKEAVSGLKEFSLIDWMSSFEKMKQKICIL